VCTDSLKAAMIQNTSYKIEHLQFLSIMDKKTMRKTKVVNVMLFNILRYSLFKTLFVPWKANVIYRCTNTNKNMRSHIYQRASSRQ